MCPWRCAALWDSLRPWHCVVGFTAYDAPVFYSINEAQELCDQLNQDITAPLEGGYVEFAIKKAY